MKYFLTLSAVHLLNKGHLEGVKSQLSGEGFGSKSSCLDARTSDRNRFTPFYLVARSGRTQIVKWLKERGCTISTPDAEGKSPLYVACSCGRRETSHAIIEMGASIEQAANDGTTPLWAAALAGRSGMMGDNIETLKKCMMMRSHLVASIVFKVSRLLHHPKSQERLNFCCTTWPI